MSGVLGAILASFTKAKENWIEMFTPPTSSPGLVAQIALDSSNNVYGAVSYAVDSNQNVPMAVKMDSKGSLTWQKGIAQTAAEENVIGIGVDSSNNVYMLGNTWAGTPGYFDQVYVKYNSSGTLQWQRKLKDSQTPSTSDFRKLVVDSSGNALICGNVNTDYGVMALIDSSGTAGAKREYSGPGIARGFVYDAIRDSSGNYYIVGKFRNSEPSDVGWILKTDSANSQQWVKKYQGAYEPNSGLNQSALPYGVTVDSSGNVYAAFNANPDSSGSPTLVINKHNSSGTLQWTRRVRPTTSVSTSVEISSGCITVDSSANIYVLGNSTGNIGFLAKYNTSGTLQWQRTFTNFYNNKSITLSNDGTAVFITGQARGTAGVQRAGFLRYPTDGSITGTYTASVWTTVIAASSYSDTSATLVVNTETLSLTTGSSPTVSTPTYSEITPTGTVTITGI